MKLSIITVNLNNAIGLRKTIESVVSQTFTDFEYIIIDGGSTDESVEVIKQHLDKITYWVSEPDKGIYNAMNKGIKVAKGEYLQFLNSGDYLINSEGLINIFVKNRFRAEILYGNVIAYDNEKKWEIIYPGYLTLNFFYQGSNICHQSVFFHKKIFEFFDGYNEIYAIGADFDLYIKSLLHNFKFEKIDCFVVYYNNEGISSTLRDKLEIEFRKSILENIPSPILYDYEILNQNSFILNEYYKSDYFILRTKNTLYRKVITLLFLILKKIDKVISK